MLKRMTLLAVAVLCLTSTSYAQQAPGKFRISGFVTNPGYTESDFAGSDFTGAATKRSGLHALRRRTFVDPPDDDIGAVFRFNENS